jgi:hypothetical protein
MEEMSFNCLRRGRAKVKLASEADLVSGWCERKKTLVNLWNMGTMDRMIRFHIKALIISAYRNNER